LFFGTTIGTCILVLKKSKNDNSVLFIDAAEEFTRSSSKNKLTELNRKTILDAFEARQNLEYFAALVPNGDLATNDYNLSVSAYVQKEDTREVVDIDQLERHIATIVERQTALRSEIDTIICDLRRPASTGERA